MSIDTVEALPAVHLASHWQGRGITTADLDHAEHWAREPTGYFAPGSWRAKVINGSLWVKMISAHAHWSERSSVLQLVRMAASSGPVGDLDMVYVHHDRDPNIHVLRGHSICNTTRGQKRCPRGTPRHLLPLLTNARQAPSVSLPVPDYSWVGWSTHTPPWCDLFRTMAAAGLRIPWRARADRAYFSGGLRTGSARIALRHVATRSGEARRHKIFELRDVAPKFHTAKWITANSVRYVKPAPQEMACKYRYLLSVPGYGYSNRLKSLLLCGSVVIHLQADWNERNG